MFIGGHVEILRQALRDLSAADAAEIDVPLVVSGLRYPDLPCANRVLKDGRVVHFDYGTCRLTSLSGLYVGSLGDRAHEIYMSHKGPLAILHSMTPDAATPAKVARKAIVDEAVVFFRLALRDDVHATRAPAPNPFWLGQVLHIVMDSYSPAHVTRDGQRDRPLQCQRPVESVGARRQPKDHATIVAMYETLERVVAPRYQRSKRASMPEQDDRLEAWVRDGLLGSMPADLRDAVERLTGSPSGLKRMFDLFEIAVFRRQQRLRFRGLLKRPAGERPTAEGVARGIRCFHNYADQSLTTHWRYDLLRTVRKHGLWEPVVRDVAFVLELYARAVRENDVRRAPAALRKYLDTVTFVLSRAVGQK